MNDIFNIDELVGHILSFVPRKFIVSCVLVNKRFKKMVKVDNDYENVVRNSDLYSLNKIKYHPHAVMQVAKKYRNFDLMEWMLRYKMELFENDLDEMGEYIGFVGKEEFFDVCPLHTLLVGMCEGFHFDLLEKYKDSYEYYYDYYIDKFAFKMGGDIQYKILSLFQITNSNLSYQIMGNCARPDKEYVRQYILDNLLLIHEDLNDSMCDGLIDGTHLDIFMEYSDDYYCEDVGQFKKLIIRNDYEFFKFIVVNNCMIASYDNVKYWDKFMREWDGIYWDDVVIYCIHFKRVDMIIFLINEITFSLDMYAKFLCETKKWMFDDIEKVFVDNYGLFRTLR